MSIQNKPNYLSLGFLMFLIGMQLANWPFECNVWWRYVGLYVLEFVGTLIIVSNSSNKAKGREN